MSKIPPPAEILEFEPPTPSALRARTAPQRYYFGFGKRIRTSQLKRDASNPDAVWAIRERVAQAVEGEITSLKAYRESDRKKQWSVLRRWLAPV